MERPMKQQAIPQTDSIRELADFWDSHDVTDFDEELEEVKEIVFERRDDSVLELHLTPEEAAAVKRLAEKRGVASTKLIEEWVRQKVQAL
jgi:hypothetical protein